ncbi:MAG: M48 family metallopeptidase [Fusobacteriota bacterium]
MKFKPKDIEDGENINVSEKSPILDMFIMLFGIIGSLIMAYIILGIFVDIVVPKISWEREKVLGKYMLKTVEKSFIDERDLKLDVNKAFNTVLEEVEDKRGYDIYISKENIINAVAFPGRKIVIYKGLLDRLESQEALTFVIAHEFGHFNNRDHLKGLGRQLVFYFLSSMIFGPKSDVTEYIGTVTKKVEMKFSQNQELNADKYGIMILNKIYGKVDGAIDFFEVIEEEENKSKLSYYFKSHPHPTIRKDNIIKYSKQP